MLALMLTAVLAPFDSPALAQDKPESSVRSKEADDVRARATVEQDGLGRLKVALDGVLLYEGPGTKAAVDVIEIARLPGRRFVTVAVDEEEQTRLLATALSRPVKVPAALVGEDPFVRVTTEEGAMTLHLVARGGRAVEIFRGPTSLGKPELFGRRDGVEVRLGDAVVYRARRAAASAAPKRVTAADFLERVNAHRRAAGVPDLGVRADLSRACDLHALYLAKNAGRDEVKGLRAHHEDPGLPGYTEEGTRAGRSSVIHSFGLRRDLVTAVDGLIATLYHRVPMLDSRLVETGAGWAFDADGSGIVVLWVADGSGPPRDEPVVYPAPDQKDVPPEFALGGRETPDPVPDANARAGYPVTVQFPWEATDVTARLACDGREVEAWVSTPQSPARRDFAQGRVACVIPKRPLEPGRAYSVEVRCRRAGGEEWSKAWSFTTARK